MFDKVRQRKKRHKRIRKKVIGTKEVPRLVVFRSLKHIYANLVDDISRATILTVSTLSRDCPNFRVTLTKSRSGKMGLSLGNIKAAKLVGENLAKKAKEKGIEKVVFDRAGYLYHGRVKALADSAKEHGLKF